MSTKKKVLKLIYTTILIIEILIVAILYMQKPINEYYNEYMQFLLKIFLIIGFLFLLCIIIYIFENRINSKNQEELDEYNIQSNFDIDFRDKDILYLSTIFNKQQPGKKELLLLIMQLIKKKIINLSCYLNGNKYQYIIEKRNLQFNNITNVEQELISYLFKDSYRVDLIRKIDEIYSKNNTKNIVNKCKEYISNFVTVKKSSMKKIFQIITTFIAILVIFVGFFIMILVNVTIKNSYTNSITIIGKYMLYGIICIAIGYIVTIILKKNNLRYKYDNDSFLWICRNLIFLNILIITSFISTNYYYLIQFIALITFIFTTLTIMIMYNEHICLSKKDIEIRKRLFSLREYFKEMRYLKDKEFGNIMTYEECLMYGFLFNITIKINDEFDILQKQLFDTAKNEIKLYIKLFQSNILK
ncbi:MAG: DUF2207 domain-containing protein [Clostridia bacterium]|nr:DUF2207 domain-containing protein [Clostridia bacterium]